MTRPEPFCRQAGRGPTVVCLHSNGSHSGQWRALMDKLADRFHLVAVDSYGAGKTPDWPSARKIHLADEVELLGPVLARASTPAYLVGHSYGAAVAFKAALLHPGRFGGLVAYEPTLFSLVDRIAPRDVDGIRAVGLTGAALLEQGDAEGAARCFIDFWMGAGAFDAMPAERQPAIVQSVANLPRWSYALFNEPATLDAFRTLPLPVLFLAGGRSPRSSESVVELLGNALPDARTVTFPRLGHMGPVTHPDQVNPEIERFLRRVAL